MRVWKIWLCAAMIFGWPGAHLDAQAQNFPNRSITLVIPFAPGGSTSIVGRVIADKMSELLGEKVVVDNRPGAGGTVGTKAVAKSDPDGYTILLGYTGTLAIGPSLYKNAGYDPRKDFAPIGLIGNAPNSLVVHPSFPARTVTELIAYAKANPGKVNFGSAGAGSITHLAGELLKAEAKVDLVHVPYKGAAPAVTDLLGGQVQMGIFDVPVLLSHIRSGKLKALAITSAKRAPALPDVPTTTETNYPNVNSDNWYGLVMPASTPANIQKRVHAAAVAALKSAAVAEQFAKVGGLASPSTPQEYAAFVAAEQAKWGKIITAIGFKEATQ
jgi:tripartite-type tricarboxylate transporter receptor subunit TctC